jgi:hypothetical protein
MVMPLLLLFRIGLGYGSVSFPIKPRLSGCTVFYPMANRHYDSRFCMGDKWR